VKYRFQNEWGCDDDVHDFPQRFGNKFLSAKNDAASQAAIGRIKLGDILASSSCFPVGFEPVQFPRDFTHANLSATELQTALRENTRFSPEKDDATTARPVEFGLIDGGIDDNQGIDSFLLAEERLRRANGFGYDLYLSCDVSSNYTSGFDFPQEAARGILRHFSVRGVLFTVALLFLLALSGVLLHVWTRVALFLLGATSVLMLGTLAIILTFRSIRKKGEATHNTFTGMLFAKGGIFLR
jgi:hypothetical protein